MARIIGDVIVKRIGNGVWKLTQPLEYFVGADDSKEVIQVPIGTETDFASVPAGFHNLFPKDGEYTPAAIIHDFLYSTLGIHGKYTRKRCDEIFLEAMGVVGVGWIRRHVMFRAVRMFGWSAWRAHARKIKKELTDKK